MRSLGWRAVLVLLGLLVFTASGGGQPTGDKPGSVLIFPYSNGEGNSFCFFTVVNTNRDLRNLPGTPYKYGTVLLEFMFINLITEGNPNEPDDDTCKPSNLTRILTPNEAFSGWVSAFNPAKEKGWFYVVARDPQTGLSIDFDFLLGSMYMIDPGNDNLWSYPAYSFEALSANSSPGPFDWSAAKHLYTDRIPNGGNGDGEISFTGTSGGFHEYEAWPHQMIIPSFLNQVGTIKSFLVLLTPLDGDWLLDLSFNYYNDDERPMGSTKSIGCWSMKPLKFFMPLAGSLQDGEGIYGLNTIKTGWAFIEGVSAWNRASQEVLDTPPPILGLIIHTIGGLRGSFQDAHLLHHQGEFGFDNTQWDLNLHAGD